MGMIKAIPFVPIVDLMFACQCFVAQCAVGGDVVFVAGGVIRPFSINIETRIRDRLLAEGAAKMFRMPISIKSREKVATDWF